MFMCGRERARGETEDEGKGGNDDGAECPEVERDKVQCPGEGLPPTGGGHLPIEGEE